MIGHETTWNIRQNEQTDISSDSDSCVNWVRNIQSLQAFMAVPFGMINATISLVSPTTDFPGCPDMMQFVDCNRDTEEGCVKNHLSTMKENHLYSGAWSEWCLTWTLIIPWWILNFLVLLLPNVLDTAQLISHTQQLYSYTQTLCETTDCSDFQDGWILMIPNVQIVWKETRNSGPSLLHRFRMLLCYSLWLDRIMSTPTAIVRGVSL